MKQVAGLRAMLSAGCLGLLGEVIGVFLQTYRWAAWAYFWGLFHRDRLRQVGVGAGWDSEFM